MKLAAGSRFFLFDHVFLIAEAFIRYVFTEPDQADQVRDRHQAVHRIGEVPNDFQRRSGAHKRDQREDHTVRNDCRARLHQIFEGFLSVVLPTEDRREREERKRDGDDDARAVAKGGLERKDRQIRAGNQLARRRIGHAERAGRRDDKPCQHADNHRVEECARHIDIALPRRVIGARRRRCNRRGAHARFIRENAARNAPTHRSEHRSDDGAADAARYCVKGKRHAEDLGDARRNGRNVQADGDNRRDEVKDRHKRNDDTGHFTDAVNAAHKDQKRKDRNDCADNGGGNPETRMKRRSNRIRLRHVADAERRADGKEREERRHDTAQRAADSVLHRVHRAARHLADAVRLTILDRQHRLAVFRRKAEERAHPHPDQSARAAEHHRRRDADDIARTDGGRKRGHQRLERRDIALVLFLFLKDHADRIKKIAPRQKLQPNRQENARADEKRQHDRPPDEVIQIVQHLLNIHSVHPIAKPGKKNTPVHSIRKKRVFVKPLSLFPAKRACEFSPHTVYFREKSI